MRKVMQQIDTSARRSRTTNISFERANCTRTSFLVDSRGLVTFRMISRLENLREREQMERPHHFFFCVREDREKGVWKQKLE
jgi:predicted membrane GTPase involved in stress response